MLIYVYPKNLNSNIKLKNFAKKNYLAKIKTTMDKNKLGKTDIYVTPVGMGVLTIGSTQLDLPTRDGASVIRYALEKGINFLDTAEYYRTYPQIKSALDDLGSSFSQNSLPYPVIASKTLAYDRKGMKRAIEECRKALDLDQIDIFLLHEVREQPDFGSKKGAWEYLLEARAKGHVKAVGISTHHSDVAADAADDPDMDILFPLINFKGLGIRKGSGPGSKEEMAGAIEKAAQKGIGIFTMKAFGGGNLIGDYKKALDFVRTIQGVTSIMVGMGSCRDVDDAVSWAEGRLPEDFVPETANKRMFVDRGDCEGCGACVSRCTSKAIRLDTERIAVIDNEKCVLCGYCSPVCPVRALIML